MPNLYAATLRMIGTSEAEANALANIVIREVMEALGMPMTDGTVQVSVEEVTDNETVTEKIRFAPWKNNSTSE